jgi:hypothetical protein
MQLTLHFPYFDVAYFFHQNISPFRLVIQQTNTWNTQLRGSILVIRSPFSGRAMVYGYILQHVSGCVVYVDGTHVCMRRDLVKERTQDDLPRAIW